MTSTKDTSLRSLLVTQDKKAKGIKNCVIKREIKFQDYKVCLENN